MKDNGRLRMPHILGATRERSKANEDSLDALERRMDKVETYAKIHAGTLGVLAAQALGVPTDQLIQILLSIL